MSLSSELTQLLTEKEEDEQRIGELEENIQVLTDCGRETDAALERYPAARRAQAGGRTLVFPLGHKALLT